ncbi:MAG: hypothetical protein J2P50_17835, partial [Hyphomicrobiaceae bacterium]|nr:hypothetical protein [Hyphomicrobiaceae bacterium]
SKSGAVSLIFRPIPASHMTWRTRPPRPARLSYKPPYQAEVPPETNQDFLLSYALQPLRRPLGAEGGA